MAGASLHGAVRRPFAAIVAAAFLIGVFAASTAYYGASATLRAVHWGLFGLFAAVCTCRLALPFLHRRSSWAPLHDSRLPAYTVIMPLRHEAEMARQIIAALQRIDYPSDRLQILFVLEEDDGATREALLAAGLTQGMQILTAPPGGPTTKPRACNVALEQAKGEFVVIYDAEDEPHPEQLREAAARFASAPHHRGCLQAPLRIHERAEVIPRQFALEYAALFEVALPALYALRLPFPLGGTSNHFRRSALADVGGWDAFNVTEDADIGVRLTACGWSLGMLSSPTWEEAPDRLDIWTPQRTRWLKGYVQTWSAAMRRPLAGGWRHLLALQATLGVAIGSAVLHAPLMLLATASLLIACIDLTVSPTLAADLGLLSFGWASAVVIQAVGARRAGLRMTPADALRALPYWSLQSLAASFALYQLATAPHHWDKTPHRPTAPLDPAVALDGRREPRIARAA